jgi:hypothetical protein
LAATEVRNVDVFVVQHAHALDEDNEDLKFIGVYSTEENAKTAVSRLSLRPGFRETADGFHIDRYVVDKDHWTDGFIRIPSEEP